MVGRRVGLYLLAIVLAAVLVFQAWAYTDPLEVSAIQDLYMSLNYPWQLKRWRSEGGDPCGEWWAGVSCSGSSIITIELRGLNLWGSLGSQLSNFHNLTHLDVSFNNIQGAIPDGLPPNVSYINLAYNNLSQNIPYSLLGLKSLQYLNLSHNSLSGPLGNLFTGLQIQEMDLSYNNLAGDLPSSFGSLMNLTALYLQNNKFTGSVIYLADLPLVELNIQDNQFSGVIPEQFQFIPQLRIWGNRFLVDSSYQPWKFPLDVVPVMQNASAIENRRGLERVRNKQKRMGAGNIVLLVGGMALLGTFVAVFAIRINRARAQNFRSFESYSSMVYSLPVTTGRDFNTASKNSPPVTAASNLPVLRPRRIPPPPIQIKTTARGKSFSSKCQVPAYANQYTVSELQLATNSFSKENFLGEGSLGSVYRAEFLDGQVFAVKNIPMSSLSLLEEEQFTEVIQTASRMRHPNIVTLLGFCTENGHHLLVYEYIGNLSLDDALHNQIYKPLSWGLRLHIALGVARALDYLHSAFCPPVAHSNLKAANILLDEELMPRLADCGLASLRALTNNTVKLKASEMAILNSGYVAPENGQPGGDATKSDVYAFGVLLLELITGRRPYDSSRPRRQQSLVKWASFRLHERESLEEMVDPGIDKTLSSRTLSQFADIISLCVQPEKEFRPPMSEIVESLTNLMHKLNTEASTTEGGTEVDPLSCRSFCSTRTRFMGSPAVSRLSGSSHN